MAGLLTAEGVAVLGHVLVDEAVADLRLLIADTGGVERLIKAEVRHDGRHDLVADELTVLGHVLPAEIHDLVAVHEISLMVDGEAAVRVTIEGEANIAALIHHIFLQTLDMRGAAVIVNVKAVRLVVNDVRIGAECVKNCLRNG